MTHSPDAITRRATIDRIIKIEGGYSDDPSDSGGATKFGITEVVARRNGYRGDMRDFPRKRAFSIYAAEYWGGVRADELLKLCPAVAAEVVDTGVNCGTNRAAKFLQQSLNVLNRRQKLYADITVDGSIGPATLRALSGYLAARDGAILVRALDCLQGAFYITLSERREKDERFIYGWLKDRVGI